MPFALPQPTDPPQLADGAWGTVLLAGAGRLPELVETWNLSQPDRVRRVAAAYRDAGAQIVLTNTFRANRFELARVDAAGQVAEINLAGARLSRLGAPGAAILGSIGPSGRLLVTHDVTDDELDAAFREQATALARGGVDALVCETFFNVRELVLAVQACWRATHLPIIGSLTFDTRTEPVRTRTGVTLEDALAQLLETPVAAVGCNCGYGIEDYVGVVRRYRAQTGLPIWAKPNAGLPDAHAEHVTYAQTPEAFAQHVPALVEAGANIIGGCCGTTPAFIAAAGRKLAELRAR